MTHKKCATCKVEFSREEFSTIKKSGKPRPYCRKCQKAMAAASYVKHREKRVATNKAYRDDPVRRARQRERVRSWHYQAHYGLTEAAKRELEAKQGNRCAICQTHFSEMDQRRVHVDHCHATGKIREILCHSCNQVLGQARDNISVLQGAIRYLRRHSAELRQRHSSGRDAFA